MESFLEGFSHPIRRKILALLREKGECTTKRIASEVGISSQTAAYHLRAMKDKEVLCVSRKVKNTEYFIVDDFISERLHRIAQWFDEAPSKQPSDTSAQ